MGVGIVTRRYFLGSVQSEERSVNYQKRNGLYILYAQRCCFVCIFYKHHIWRRDSQNPPLQRRQQASTKKYLGDTLFPRYFYYIFHPNSSLKSRTTVFRNFSKNRTEQPRRIGKYAPRLGASEKQVSRHFSKNSCYLTHFVV